MKTIRRCLCLILAFAMLLLSGCHGSRGLAPFQLPEEFDTTRDYEITFWAKNDTNKTQANIYQAAIDGFQKLYPNIHVTLRLYTDYGKIYNDVITNISTNTTPNVCITYPDHIATYTSGSNCVVPLDELICHPAFGLGGSQIPFDSPTAEEIIPQFLQECRFDGKLFALPYMRSTEACYINKTYVEALGYQIPDTLTWDFIWEVSDAAAKKGADGNFLLNGQPVMIPFLYKSTDNMMIQLLAQSGAGYTSDSGEILLFNDTTRQILQTVADHVGTGAFSTFKISSYPANFLNAGQCVFAIDSTAGSTWMGTNAPLSDISEDKLVEFETEVRPIPQIDPEHPKMISQGPSVCVFNKSDPGEVLASWLFTQYLLTNEVQIPYAQTEGYVPVTTKAQESDTYRSYLAQAGTDNGLHYDVKLKATQLLLDHTNNTFVTPVFNGSASVRDAAGQLIENTAKSVRRGHTVDGAYYDQLFEEVSALYRLDQVGGGHPASSSASQDMGRLPTASVILLGSLAAAWICIVAYSIFFAKRKK